MARLPYSQEITRQDPACVLFLLDQSYSMTEPLAKSPDSKATSLVKAINGWLYNAILRCADGAGYRDYMDIGVIGYRTDQDRNPIVEPALIGPLKGRELVTITDLATNPARVDSVSQKLFDEATGTVSEVAAEMPAWVDPLAEGGTPLCTTLHRAYGILEGWITKHPRSFPPIVINISDGEADPEQGDPTPYADAVKSLSTEDGNVLMFNCHLSMTEADPFYFPNSDEVLPDQFSRQLFHLSSVMPDKLVERAIARGFDLKPGARSMVFNADLVCLIKFLDIGTPVNVSSPLR